MEQALVSAQEKKEAIGGADNRRGPAEKGKNVSAYHSQGCLYFQEKLGTLVMKRKKQGAEETNKNRDKSLGLGKATKKRGREQKESETREKAYLGH